MLRHFLQSKSLFFPFDFERNYQRPPEILWALYPTLCFMSKSALGSTQPLAIDPTPPFLVPTNMVRPFFVTSTGESLTSTSETNNTLYVN